MSPERELHALCYLVNGVIVVCPECAAELVQIHGKDALTLTRVYRVNIGQYRQTCHPCGMVIVSGQSEKWPELWPAEVPLPILTLPEGKAGATC